MYITSISTVHFSSRMRAKDSSFLKSMQLFILSVSTRGSLVDGVTSPTLRCKFQPQTPQALVFRAHGISNCLVLGQTWMPLGMDLSQATTVKDMICSMEKHNLLLESCVLCVVKVIDV